MSTVDTKNDIVFLREWQNARLREWGEGKPLFKIGPKNVTVLAYFYRPESQVSEYFSYLKCAIYETWRHCGVMKTVIVTNLNEGALKEFADKWGDFVEVQVEPSLRVGDLNAMSIDCNSKLYQRFDTEYVLIVQDDGFPLRSGLEKFLGKWDFLGSPMRRNTMLVNLLGIVRRHWPSNGGFSLRTKKMCRLVAEYWNKYYADKPFDEATGIEDLFYTKTLQDRFLSFRWRVNVGNASIASEFAYDACLGEGINLRSDVFGFHSARAFAELMRK
ncbi:MAG: hypothetical protein IKC27_07875 [Kiritimatiellae bacterium]|nr:hypothetical protein [Kiritimatiellia bacterium]